MTIRLCGDQLWRNLLNFHAGFRDAPPSPPSLSRQLETANKHAPVSGCRQLSDFIVTSILSLRNIYFLLYVIVSGTKLGINGPVWEHG